jgi:hypothetical protein
MTRPLDRAALLDAAPLPRHRGQRSQQVLDALHRRDELLREAAARFYAGMSARTAAVMLHRELARYASLAWRRDRIEVQCPARHVGRIAEQCWLVFAVRDHVPSERVIRRALRHPAFRGPLPDPCSMHHATGGRHGI